MKKAALLIPAVAVVIGAGTLLLQPSIALGNWGDGIKPGFAKMLETKAELLGLSVEELETQLEDKTFPEIAEDQGISPEVFHEQMREKARERWQEMGLSEEEIAEKEKWMEEKRANCDGGHFMRKFGKRWDDDSQ